MRNRYKNYWKKFLSLIISRIKAAINALAENPRPLGSKKLHGRPGYRIRRGNYRVVYEINDSILTIFIIDAGNRKNIYE